MSKEDNLSKEERKEVKKEIGKALQEKLVLKANGFKSEFKKQTATAIMAAFGLIIALAWKDVISEFVNNLGFVKQYGLLISAVVITLISVLGIMLISRWSKTGGEK